MASSLALWTSYYPAIQAEAVQGEQPCPAGAMLRGCGQGTFARSRRVSHLPGTAGPASFAVTLVLMALHTLCFILVHRIHFYHAARNSTSLRLVSALLLSSTAFLEQSIKCLLQEDTVIYKQSKRKRMMPSRWYGGEGLLGGGK